jgi:hypothetical protein
MFKCWFRLIVRLSWLLPCYAEFMIQPDAIGQASPNVQALKRLHQAKRLFWVAFVLFVAAELAARVWDSYWHTTYTFDGFFSPPHLFIYGATLVNMALFEGIILRPELRRYFGERIRIPGLRFEVPGALVLVNGAYLILAFAGLGLDNLWHTRFGLDETMWSLPHALLGWSWLIVLSGFVACYLAVKQHQPFFQHTTLVLAFFVLGISASSLLGPFYENATPQTLHAIASLPVLQSQHEAERVFQIYLTWNLNRTNPLLAPIGALWAGIVLAFLSQLDTRQRILIASTYLWTVVTALGDYMTARRLDQFFPVLHDPLSWLPLPIFPATLLYVALTKTSLSERWRWLICGWTFGTLVFLFWGSQPITLLLAILSGPTMLGGALFGRRLYCVLEAPTRRDIGIILVATVGIPSLLGLLDLYLRGATP